MKLRWKIAQLFEFWWWKHYLNANSLEEYLKWKTAYWQDFLSKTGLQFSKNERLLEIGCGPAGLFMMFPQNNMTSIDPLLKKYRKSFSHLTDKSFSNVEFQSVPLEVFFDKKGYDTIFCLNVINHVADLDKCFNRMGQLMRPSAKLVMTIDVHNWRLLKKIFRLFPGDILHPHQHSLTDYITFLQKIGCKIKTIKPLRHSFVFDYYLIVASK